MQKAVPLLHLSPNERLAKRLRPLALAPTDGLMVHEIYVSIQGEGTHAGLPCVFVRTTACNLRCSYCDTRQAFANGKPWALDAVIAEVAAFGPKLCLITGGEPMLQSNVLPLMTRLADLGFTVLLETSGSIDLAPVDPRVVCIIDMKTPSSGEVDANLYGLLTTLRPHDEVKFVLGDENDYDWAKTIVAKYALVGRCSVLFGPVFDVLDPKELVAWVLRDHMEVRVQVQLHKYIWDAKTQGV
jgi:7-carboxy-7-deazaguanine synthase